MADAVVVKIGGRAAEDRQSLAALCDELASLARERPVVLLHGGGAEVTAVCRRLGM